MSDAVDPVRAARAAPPYDGRLAALTGDHAGIVEASRDSNADDEHDPEGATIAFERSQVGTLVAAGRAASSPRSTPRWAASTTATTARASACGTADPGRPGSRHGRPRRTCVGC